MVEKLFKAGALILIGLYRSVGSLWLGGSCRFEPSCSQYAVEAFQKLSFFSAAKKTLRRISKCRPGGGFGLDPLEMNCDNHRKGHHESTGK